MTVLDATNAFRNQFGDATPDEELGVLVAAAPAADLLRNSVAPRQRFHAVLHGSARAEGSELYLGYPVIAESGPPDFFGPIEEVEGERVLVRLEDRKGRRERRWFQVSDLDGRPEAGSLVVIRLRRSKAGMMRLHASVVPPPTEDEVRREEERLKDLFPPAGD